MAKIKLFVLGHPGKIFKNFRSQAECGAKKVYFASAIPMEARFRHIKSRLSQEHNIDICKRTLERALQRNQLWRRRNKADIGEVADSIHRQLQSSGQQHGYRWMQQKCWMAGIITDRETVRLLLRQMDGGGVDLRARHRLRRRVYVSRGPKYVWHIDGWKQNWTNDLSMKLSS